VACYNIDVNSKTAEVGRFLMNPQMRSKGYMHKAIQLLLQFCKDRLKIEYVYLEVITSNHRAINLYRKLGFIEDPSTSSSDILKMNRVI
jgi:RimJ/RimL family protein N-acetyltransferase